MKNALFFFLLTSFLTINAQQSYYDNINLNLNGTDLRDELSTLITSTHTKTLDYGEARDALKIIDLKPNQNSNVLLLYGFSNNTCVTNTSDDNDHRLRNKNSFGDGSTCEWNREHTYPKSLGNPNLGKSGPGADVHHLRASDVQRNSRRGSLKFNSGNGNSGESGSGWYPGDEWKGDVARMMMYMYLRYGKQCFPKNVANGSVNSVDSNMINLLLAWNAEDPVSEYEDQRNNYLEKTSNRYGQGNRNPFIDNPNLATRIWGGPTAENRWSTGSTYNNLLEKISTFPNPTSIGNITIKFPNSTEISKIEVFSVLGKKILNETIPKLKSNRLELKNLKSGIYILKASNKKSSITKKLIVK